MRIIMIIMNIQIKFYAGDVMGFYGFSFMDLVEHEYVEEEITQNIQPKQVNTYLT